MFSVVCGGTKENKDVFGGLWRYDVTKDVFGGLWRYDPIVLRQHAQATTCANFGDQTTLHAQISGDNIVYGSRSYTYFYL